MTYVRPVNLRPRSVAARAALFAAALSLVVVGCRSSSPQNTYVLREHVHQVDEHLIDRGLGKQVELVESRAERRQGRLQVQAQLRNTTTRERRIEWQAEWYDATGLQVASPTNWKPERLGGGQILTIRQTAPSEAATSMRLNVRESDTIE